MSTSMDKRAREVAPQVLRLLRAFKGKQYILRREDIAGRLQIQDRILSAAILELRRQGYLIVSDSGGYRFARNWQDVLQYTNGLKSRMQVLREVVTRMETTAAMEFRQRSRVEQKRLFDE